MRRVTTGIHVRNVNHALRQAVAMTLTEADDGLHWRRKAPRGMPTIEYRGLVVTEYEKPTERVLFSSARDANPFFHFFEALWILDGRQDVEFLAQFNANMRNFSDDGEKFHAPYGHRLRSHFIRGHVDEESGHTDYMAVDQLTQTVELLRKEPDTRRAVMCIWDPAADLNVQSKDLPCNDLIMMGLDDNKLDMEVVCRSNDVIWGAYGANAVQFSFLQEFLACALNVEVGQLSQISRSFHFYLENPTFKKLQDHLRDVGHSFCPYETGEVEPWPLMKVDHDENYYVLWLDQLRAFMNKGCRSVNINGSTDPFFMDVAFPMYRTWAEYKNPTEELKARRIRNALSACDSIAATDWRMACENWLTRREGVSE
jgi:hypothetical protein